MPGNGKSRPTARNRPLGHPQIRFPEEWSETPMACAYYQAIAPQDFRELWHWRNAHPCRVVPMPEACDGWQTVMT